jgi:hypothetical protein
MDSIEVLRRMIAQGARIALLEKGGKLSVELTEPQAPDSKVTIRGLPEATIVIKLDSFAAPDGLLTCERGECKRADYAIVAASATLEVVLFVELKRTKASREDIEKQLRGGECIIAYCKQIAAAFYGEAHLLQGYAARFISLGHTSINKRRTRFTRSAARHDRPEHFMQIDWPATLYFNRLVGG